MNPPLPDLKADDTDGNHNSNHEDRNENENENVVNESKQEGSKDTESSSSDGGGKENGSGSGSGGGYAADCSSSDTSTKDNDPSDQLKELNLMEQQGEDDSDGKPKAKPSKKEGAGKKKGQHQHHRSHHRQRSSRSSVLQQAADGEGESSAPLEETATAQINGVRVSHPMDPRIDLSNVGHVRNSNIPREASGLHANMHPSNINIPDRAAAENEDVRLGSNSNNTSGSDADAMATDRQQIETNHHPQPSVDQYMKLMEVVRPFFTAHGFSIGQADPFPLNTRYSQGDNDRAVDSSEFSSESSGPSSSSKESSEGGQAPVPEGQPTVSGPTKKSKSQEGDEEGNSDSSSMVVLARTKRKHQKEGSSFKGSSQDGSMDESKSTAKDGGSSNNSNDSSNNQRRVRIQHPIEDPQLPPEHEDAQNPVPRAAVADASGEPSGGGSSSTNNEGEDGSSSSPSSGNAAGEGDNQAGGRHQNNNDSTSSSSSSRQQRPNNDGDENMMIQQPAAPVQFGLPPVVSEYSSSARAGTGSGSAENTGSGSGTGSNQGGSSGSGNDQAGSSANGNGSSASGQDAKGSSEETMENSAENENSSESNSKDAKTKPKPPGGVGFEGENDEEKQAPSSVGNASREERLQDKKRKRMNMRREYEEKVQKEMDSSEASRDDSVVKIKPGRPVTLDKVLSFTKIPRIVVKAGPPFLVVYTNAAYCRLSGVDSHYAVGKSITALLAIPESTDSTGNDETANSGSHQAQGEEARPQDSQQQQPGNADNSGDQTYLAAEAAGRARAEATQEDKADMCLERLIAASGYGQIQSINLLSKSNNGDKSAGKDLTGEARSNESSLSSSAGESGPNQVKPCIMSISPVVSSPEAFMVTAVTDNDQESRHHKSKRRKHHHHDNATSPQSAAHGHNHSHHPRSVTLREISLHRKRHLITHFVIQLEPSEGVDPEGNAFGNLEGEMNSAASSTTAEAHLLGLTKSELRRHRNKRSAASAKLSDRSSFAADGPRDDNNDNDMDVDGSSGGVNGGEDANSQSSSGRSREAVTAIG